MKELILIPCSNSKRKGGTKNLSGRKISTELSKNDANKLKELRKEVSNQFNINLDHKNTKLRPAFERYSGNIYSKVPKGSWNTLESMDDTELVIISALYGMIYWDQPIINYDVAMCNNIRERRRLATWWKNNGLPEIIKNYIKKKDFETIRSFLSNDYKQALNNIPEKIESNWLEYKYPTLTRGINHFRGEDLNKALLNKDQECPNCGSRLTKRKNKEFYECIKCKNEYTV